VVAFEVADTGIGIPPDKQRIIFEAFQQSDGTTSRKYGGTGLGLTISRQLVRLLGGQMDLRSEPGRGSTFTVYVPVEHPSVGQPAGAAPSPRQAALGPGGEVPDDRDQLAPGDAVVLIVDDDVNFCRVLLNLAHQSGFKGIVALRGEEALALAHEYRPAAVTLDIGLRDVSGWKVLESLRADPATASIPVHIVTVFEDAQDRVDNRGALTFLTKPASKDQLQDLFTRIQEYVREGARHVLVVEDDDVQRAEIVAAVGEGDVVVHEAASVHDAIAVVEQQPVDCVVLDLRLPDSSGFRLLDHFRADPRLRRLPVVVYTAADLTLNESESLRQARYGVVVKGKEHAARDMLEQVGRFLARVGEAVVTPADRPPEPPPDAAPVEAAPVPAGPGNGRAAQGLGIETLAARPEPAGPLTGELAGRTVLVVDDDVRNVFALTAMLERHGLRTRPAESGEDALAALEAAAGEIDVVLLDIMMPDMDGYETLRRIRSQPGFGQLPIIALTAQAMKGDRERCLEAGASDYIAKPIEAAELLRMLRTWLSAP
jgi:CheY-like chemotaxis protein